jgi:hypothetical protein
MSNQSLPNPQKQWLQSNDGDYNGNVWASFNADLDSNPGTYKASKRLKRAVGADKIGSDIVQALQIHDGNYYIATNDSVLNCSVNSDPTVESNWNTISTLGLEDLGLETDMTSFNNLLLISLGTDIMSWDGSSKDDDWWTTGARSGSALTADKTHTLEVLRSGTDTLFITDGNKIRYYNGAAAGTVITVDEQLTNHCMTPSLDRMWVGAYTEVGNNGYIFEVQVGATNTLGDPAYNQSYEVDGRVPLTMWTYNNTPFTITERGYIQYFNGAAFQTIAMFPWANDSSIMEGCRPGLVQDSATSRAIHPKGVKVKGKYAYIYVDASDEYNTGELLSKRGASGVWVLNMETFSLTHRYALTNATTDYGSQKTERSGPVLITNTPETRIMVGGEVSTQKGVWMEGDETAQSYIVTTRHEAQSVTEAFESLIIKSDTLDSTGSILAKYKDVTIPDFPYKINDVTWLNATQFNTSDALTGVRVGDEVEILSGYRAGYLAHITAIEGTTTKSVTVDESIGLLNELSDVQIDRYKKITDVTDATDGEYKKHGAGETSTSRQHKVVINGKATIREITSKGNAKNER